MTAIRRWTAEELRDLCDDESTVDALMFIRTLSDVDVVEGARLRRDSSGWRQVRAYMDRDTNPNWIDGRLADEAYERGLIDEREFDYLSDK